MSFDPDIFDERLFGQASFDCVFDKAIFDGAVFDTCEETGIGLADPIAVAPRTPPIDFVSHGARWLAYRRRAAPRISAKRETSELKEMLEVYGRWKKAA